MPFYHSGLVRYYRFNSLEHSNIYHAIFTRQGGVSPAPWKSLNLGNSVGDDQGRVAENHHLAFEALGINENSIYDVFQVHSSNVIYTNASRPKHSPHLKADAIITDQPNITLMMRFADCVPILLFDPKHHAIGIAHAGWKGTVDKIAIKVVTEMNSQFGTQPTDIFAAIGPSIGPDHYMVGREVIDKVKLNFGQEAVNLLSKEGSVVRFNLWAANQLILVEAGVNKIETCEICTACHIDDWFSHRSEQGNTGRFGAVIGLRY